MPLYEYQCEACAYRFEVIQKFADPPVSTCQKCGGAVRKLLSSPAIQFKGTGWYITDYARKGGVGSGESAGADKSDKPSGPGSAATAPASTGTTDAAGATGKSGSSGGSGPST
jgi:putative FmdB family regulatory protein